MIPFYAQNSTLSFCRKKYSYILKQKMADIRTKYYIKPINVLNLYVVRRKKKSIFEHNYSYNSKFNN